MSSRLVLLYLAWLAFGCMTMWTISRWSVRRRLSDSITALAAVLAALPIAVLLIVLLFAAPQTTHPLDDVLVSHQQLVATLYFIWPFTAALTAAQIMLRRSGDVRRARLGSFAAGVGAAGAAPLALLLAACGAAGACL